MTPELKASVSIDAVRVAAGWRACKVAEAKIHASVGVVIREVETNLQRAQALRQATPARAFGFEGRHI
jgi:hypothetical protein